MNLAIPLRAQLEENEMATESLLPKTGAQIKAGMEVCIVDDDPANLELLQSQVEQMGFAVEATIDPGEALQFVREGRGRVVIADWKMPVMDGFTFLAKALEYDPGVQVILVTGYYSYEGAVEAIRRGACDYIPKPVERARLQKTLDELAAIYDRRRRTRDLNEELLTMLEEHGVVGRSPVMLDVMEMARKVARHFVNVLVIGPTGCGKELVAKALHRMSPVSQQKFAVCNCSALVDTLLESQLFGHIRGSFTGATETRAGLFEFAHGGTVFLDEIGEMSLTMQSKLLRVIQYREIQRVGSPEVKKVDVRLIAATNRDLREEVLAGRFREDLYHRLSTIYMRVPGLAERPDDIPLLVHYFLKRANETYGKNIQGLTRRAQTALLRYAWPGNVRELENVISSAALLSPSDFIDLSDLPEHLQKAGASPVASQLDSNWQPLPLEDVKARHIERVLEYCNGNRVRASELLGIGRTSLYRHLEEVRKKKKASQTN